MKKPSSDHVRLTRAFKIPPTKRGLAITVTTAFAAIGALGASAAFIPATALLAALGGFEVTDRRAIAKGLRELDAWGFPIEGYREWLLGAEPAFEVELRREVDLDVIETSVAAIDPAIVVRRMHPRVFRIVTPRIALPAARPGGAPIYLGDRRLLLELYERLLAPLHADVGIVALRMGDHATLTALAPTSTRDHGPEHGESLGAFREPAMAAPPALQALVVSGGTSLSLTEDPRRLRFRAERVLDAAGRSRAGLGTVAGIGLGGLWTGAQLGIVGAGVGTVAGLVGGIVAAIVTNRRNARAVANLAGGHGFPVEGYDDWLISGRPLLELELTTPLDRDAFVHQLHRLEAFSTEANATVRWVEGVTWLDDTRVRIETRPTLIRPSSGKLQPFYGGSHILFQGLVTEVLAPLHARGGIKRVRMGGYVDRRV